MMSASQDHAFMQEAIQMAKQAANDGEVPVGAILVYQNEIIAKGWNQPIYQDDPTAHAEIQVLRAGAKQLGNYRLIDTTLYVTLEPCVMCAGAMVHARIHRLVYGASDPRCGAAESVFNILNHRALNHHVIFQGKLLEQECSALLKDFFIDRR